MKNLAKTFLATALLISLSASAQQLQIELDIPYCTVDGKTETLNAFYFKDSEKPTPAMVDIHGGWFFGGEPLKHAPGEFASKGIATFSVAYRLGHDGGFPQNIRDCRNAIRFIRKNAARFNIDPERIGVTGGSAGGHLTLMVAMVPEDFDDGGPTEGREGISARVCCGFGYIAPTDFVRFWNQGPDDVITNAEGKISFRSPDDKIPYDSRPRLRILFHGVTPDTTEHRALYTKMSPVGHIRNNLPPLLICDGEKDPIVPGLHGKVLYEELKSIGADVTYWMTPNGGHGYPDGPGFGKVRDEFLKRTLKLDVTK